MGHPASGPRREMNNPSKPTQRAQGAASTRSAIRVRILQAKAWKSEDMADPFSIFAGSVSVAEACIRVGNYVRLVAKTTRHIDEELKALQAQVDGFNEVNTSLAKLCASNRQNLARKPCDELWVCAARLIQEGQALVEKLSSILEGIFGEANSSRFPKAEDIKRAIKLLSKNAQYQKVCERLAKLNLELNTMFTAIELAINMVFHTDTSDSLKELPAKVFQEFQERGLLLKGLINELETSDTEAASSIRVAKDAMEFASLNKHFYVQKADTSIWTGRNKYLNVLKDAMLNGKTERRQARYVVHGISGSGKTQLCCKFAQDYRESFWGIFWIDASNLQSAAESWKRIAKIGGKDPNEHAGRFWLSNVHSPWLLIIDGADYSENIIHDQFPTGELGCIIITTRNPHMAINATAGSLTLDKLEESDANELLRKATRHEPWDRAAIMSASSIARHLGYLPLALVHAGRTIFHKLCTLQDYIPFFNRTIEDFRKKKRAIAWRDEDDDAMGPFTSFDIIYTGMEAKAEQGTSQSRAFKDAMELMNVFAFFHNADIRLEVLTRAGNNIPHEQEARNSLRSLGNRNDRLFPMSVIKPWLDYMKSTLIRFMIPKAALPKILQVSKNQAFDERRARKAVDLLVQLSLLSESTEPGSYSMHPLVHVWTRKRLETSAQAMWCGAAGAIVAASVKPMSMKEEPGDQDYYLRILSHIDQVLDHKAEIELQLQQNALEASYMRRLIWMCDPSTYTALDALHAAKYSRVYMQGSNFQSAEKLLRPVLKFVIETFGPKNFFVVPASLGLSLALWHLGEPEEAQILQERALEVCKSTMGENHPQTLKVMDDLGRTYWQRGWLKQAKALHQAAIAGMEDKPELIREKLNAMTHLGFVHEWYMEFDMAQNLHETASEGLNKEYGPDDLDTLTTRDGLAMTLLQSGDVDKVKQAREIMQDVYDRRKRLLGPENLHTLWAMCNLARTFTEQGTLEQNVGLIQDAKSMFDEGLAICRRNLGGEHLGTLMGRHFRAIAIAAEKDYEQAENEYMEIAELQKKLPGARSGTHRDRLMTLQSLASCYEEQGKKDEAYQVCTTVIQELDNLGGQQHPFRIKTAERRDRLKASMEQIVRPHS